MNDEDDDLGCFGCLIGLFVLFLGCGCVVLAFRFLLWTIRV